MDEEEDIQVVVNVQFTFKTGWGESAIKKLTELDDMCRELGWKWCGDDSCGAGDKKIEHHCRWVKGVPVKRA